MFSFRNLVVAGSASIPILGLLFGVFIGLHWLRAIMSYGVWRMLPVALVVAFIYFVLNIIILAPFLGEFMAAKWAFAFLFTAWGVSYVGQQLDQAMAQPEESAN